MQQFTVPQFIDVEDKIIGPVTTRQFVIMLLAFILSAISYKIFDFSLFVTFSILVMLVFGVFAFGKINSRPFHFFVLNLIQTLILPGLRVWNHALDLPEDKYEEKEKQIMEKHINLPSQKQLTVSRLAELSLVVDTKGTYKGENKIQDTDIKSV